MAVVTPEPLFTQRVTLSRFNDIEGVCVSMANRGEIAPNAPDPLPVAQVIEDQIYVAVGKEVKDSRMTLLWAVQNSGGKKICIIYVLVPEQKIPVLGTESPVRDFREVERHKMHKILDEYLNICRQMGVRAEKLFLEKDSIEKGILELIDMHGIRKLVMGAASDKRYSRRMVELKSKKAVYIRDEAPISCHVWFICNGRLIYTREGSADRGADARSSLSRTSSNVGNSNLSRSSSAASRKSEPVKLTNPVQNLLIRVFSSGSGRSSGRLLDSRLQCDPGVSEDTHDMRDTEDSFHDRDRVSRRNASLGSAMSCSSRSSLTFDVVPLPLSRSTTNDSRIKEDGISNYIPPSNLLGNDIYDQLEQALSESENARGEALQEAIRRGQAEKAFLEAVRKVRTLEIWLSEEKKQREGMEEALAIEEEKVQKMKNELDEVSGELHLALDQKSQLESQISHSDNILREYEQKIISAVGLLQAFREERDNLQIERDNALTEAEELRRRRREGETSTSFALQYLSEIPFSEIEEATLNFDPSMQIGEGRYGSMYKGYLRHTQVAIKMLHSHNMQGPSEFQQEVDVLSKVRHPNIITLIGACPDAWSLVYEYLPNGSLEDRLCCKDNTSPLSWQIRIRIAAELCSALAFLHSSKPNSIVHGDVKPESVLLDAHFVSKLEISRRLLSQKSTSAYADPGVGEVASPKSDVYSFGIILLRLLTGKNAVGVLKEVQNAVDEGNLKEILDPLAGDWPYVQAEQLANLGLSCCDVKRDKRPDLRSEVWRTLTPMRAFCGGGGGSLQERSQPPYYFICPILQEVMEDPVVASDGFTYEAEALRGWLDSGHNSSPMTNISLAHTNLVPNRALRSAIQEWRLHNPNQ